MAVLPEAVSHPLELRHEHRLCFTRGVFAPGNPLLASVLAPRDPGLTPRALVCWDAGLESAFPGFAARIEAWFAAHADQVRLAAPPVRLPGGEAVKNDLRHLETVWAAINAAGLCRHSYVVAVGGGAVLDLVGFGASTAHRGIPLVRLPTTSLSQGDGGVGVKNGINFFGKKNWLGAFTVPHAIVNDLDFLTGLPPRERRCGLIEAVKVALIRDAAFFQYIAGQVAALRALEPAPFEAVICESARQHLRHIATAGDPFELGSARPLDFGHWAAHKLEQLSEFRVSHGEAVAVGMAVDLLYSVKIDLLPRETAEEILNLIETVGFEVWSAELDREERGRPVILAGLEEFREHLGGRLTITLVPGIGEKLEVHEMDENAILAAISELRTRSGRLAKVTK